MFVYTSKIKTLKDNSHTAATAAVCPIILKTQKKPKYDNFRKWMNCWKWCVAHSFFWLWTICWTKIAKWGADASYLYLSVDNFLIYDPIWIANVNKQNDKNLLDAFEVVAIRMFPCNLHIHTKNLEFISSVAAINFLMGKLRWVFQNQTERETRFIFLENGWNMRCHQLFI